MFKFEKETGKKAIWMGKITETFKKWQRGEKIYESDQERIGILVPSGTKNSWQDFAEKKGFSTISKLIRRAVNNYIENSIIDSSSKDLSEFSQKLKQILTPIKGNSEFLIRYHTDKLDPDVSIKIKEILDQSNQILDELNQFTNGVEHNSKSNDVLIIEDDPPTMSLLADFFKMKGFSCKGVNSAKDGLEELKMNTPKLILLDIILPDIEGYEVCKEIRESYDLKELLIYYITARPEKEVSKKLKETGADGFLLKPFNFEKVENLAEKLETKYKR
jgi:CheY-like chemotaxis protein